MARPLRIEFSFFKFLAFAEFLLRSCCLNSIATGVPASQMSLLLVRKDLLYPSDPAVIQPHFDPARMEKGGCKDILHDSNGAFAGSLVLFQNNFDALSGPNVAALLTVHCTLPLLLHADHDLYQVALKEVKPSFTKSPLPPFRKGGFQSPILTRMGATWY